MHWNVILADTAAPAQAAPGTQAATGTPAAPPTPTQMIFGNPIFLLVVLGILMYVAVFRPQQLRTKQQAKLLAALKSGDKVVTSSGIVGTVITVKDKTVSLRSADAKMEVTKPSITEILESSDDASTTP